MLVAVAVLLVSPAAFADYIETFGGYQSGTVSPSPWTGATTNSNCLQAYVNQTSTAYILPNVYTFRQVAGCYTVSNTASISLTVNASASVVTIKWVQGISGVSGGGSGLGTCGGGNVKNTLICGASVLTLSVGSSTVYTNDTSTIKPGFWSTITGALFANAGTTYTVKFQIQTAPESANYGFIFDLGQVTIKGANVVSASPNLYLMDYASHQWFNISGYTGSRIIINYTAATSCPSTATTQGNSCIWSNLQIPDLNVPLSNAKLITVWVGTKYFRQLVPTSLTKVVVLLDNPSYVLQYSLGIEDLTGTYGPGTLVTVSTGAMTISSGYADVGPSFAVSLVPGSYKGTLTSGTNSYSFSILAGQVGSSISIPVQAFTFKGSLGTFGSVTYGAGWNCTSTGIIATFSDSSISTTQVAFTLEKVNGSGAFVLSTLVLSSGPYGTVTTTFAVAKSALVQYLVLFKQTTASAVVPFGPVAVTAGAGACPNSSPGIFPNIGILPSAVLGLNQIFPVANAWMQFISLVALAASAGIFGAKAAPFGLLVTLLEAGLFYLAGWLAPAITAGLLTTFGILALVQYLLLRHGRVSL